MNKTALKKFATSARLELLERVELQAMKFGLTKEIVEQEKIVPSNDFFINGKPLTDDEKKQRNKLMTRFNEIGFDRVIDEVAYTWFNRFTALRFMEVNDYIPTKVRVLSSRDGQSNEPEMIAEALTLDLDLDKEKIYNYKMNNETEALFKYLIIQHCNDLNKSMPFMFETINDYTELLFPDGLLSTDSFIREMTNMEMIPEENWEKIEVIGWLYQYYIADEKDEVFANLKKNIKISKEKVPAATQLFTPNWIVRYMVENSLGHIWLESNPETSLKSNWTYFLEEAEQDEKVMQQLEKIRYKDVDIEEITFIDPSCGSGHILVYAFDVLFDMYLEKGYMEREIPKLIIEKNLFGLDVDDRAAQLASFALMMKAREKSRRVFRQKIQPNITSILESNWLTEEQIASLAKEDERLFEMLQIVHKTFIDAKEYGSLLMVSELDFDLIEEGIERYLNEEVDLLGLIDKQIVEERLPQLITQAKILSNKYDIVCTNPPYMGRKGMSPKLTKYLDVNYKDTKSDLFAAFIERGFDFTSDKGFNSMVTMQSWMFLSSFEKMRTRILNEKVISTLLHMDNNVMGIAFGTAATIFRNFSNKDFKGNYVEVTYKDINDYNMPISFPIESNRSGQVSIENFNKIPGSPIAYWANELFYQIYEESELLKGITEIKKGLTTGKTDKFIKYWFEVSRKEISFKPAEDSSKKWYPCHKGGGYRKWYGNLEKVINWENDGYEIKNYKDNKGRLKSRPQNLQYMLKEGIIFSKITSAGSSCRLMTGNEYFDDAVQGIFTKDTSVSVEYLLAVLNSSVIAEFLKILNPTINKQIYDLERIPISISENYNKIKKLSAEAIKLSVDVWNESELSWDYKSSKIIPVERECYFEKELEKVKAESKEKQHKLMKIEREIEKEIYEAYNFKEVNRSRIELDTKTQSDQNVVREFLSYFIGCTFGRYSLNEEGLVYAGGIFDPSRYKKFAANEDNIIPILDESYLKDDIVKQFEEFLTVIFSANTLEENLDFIADVLVRRKDELARETIRRYFMNEFYKNHTQFYKKRPIYWLFTSGKEKAFNCLVYMHRYDKTTLSRIRTDYLHPTQARYDVKRQDLINIIEGDYITREINDAKKKLTSLDKKIAELKEYDEVLHHMADMQIEIDLDDGVKVNYEKFKGLVAKI